MIMARRRPRKRAIRDEIEGLRLVVYTIHKYPKFRRVHSYMYDDLISVGVLAMWKARLIFDPKKGPFSSIAITYIKNALWRHVQKEELESGRYRQENLFHADPKKSHPDEMRAPRDTNTFRPIPAPPNLGCVTCGKFIDWTGPYKHRKGSSKRRGTCGACERAKNRAKQKGYGHGICVKCIQVIRTESNQKTGTSRPKCGCWPLWPCYTLEDLDGPPELA